MARRNCVCGICESVNHPAVYTNCINSRLVDRYKVLKLLSHQRDSSRRRLDAQLVAKTSERGFGSWRSTLSEDCCRGVRPVHDRQLSTMQRPIVPLLRTSLERIAQQFRSTSAPCSLSQNRTFGSLPDDERGGLPRSNGDRLILRGMRFHGRHGVLQEERNLGQKFDVDLDAWMDLSKAGETDCLEDSVSYADIYSQIKGIVEGPPHLLLESVATAIAKAVLEQHPQISDVRVRVGKPHVAVVGVLDVLGVEIFRNSSHFTQHQNNQKET